MAPRRIRFKHKGGRVTQDGVVQRFQVPDNVASLRILTTQTRHGEGFDSVLVRAINGGFKDYDHIKRELPRNVEVPPVADPSDPLRIRAYPSEVLRVIYAKGIEYQPGDESEGGGGGGGGEEERDDDTMGDDDDDENDGYLTDGDDLDDFGNQSGATVDFSESQYEMNGSLSIQSLNPASAKHADSHPSRTRSFFALPISMLDKEGNLLPMEQSSWLVFRVCESGGNKLETGTWIPHFIHERTYGIIRHGKAAWFVESFGAILLSKAKWFRDALLSTSFSADPAPMSDHELAVSHLCRELHLDSNVDFEPYLQKIIEDLEKSISTYASTDTSTERQRTTRSALLSHLDQEDSNAMDVDDDNESGAYLTTDRYGRQHHICKYHHKRMYPGYTPGYVEAQTNGVASYEILTGKIVADLKSQAALTNLSRIDPEQVGFVSESVITIDWEASMEDIHRLLEFAVRFGIAAMTISGGERQETFATTEQVEAETNYVQELLGTMAAISTRVTVMWDSKLDVSALLKGMSETRQDLLYLTIKDSQLEVSSVIYRGHLQVSCVKSALGHLPSVSGDPFLAGKAQSLEVSSAAKWSDIKDTVKQTMHDTIQPCFALTTLTMECQATGYAFKSMVKAIDGVVRPLNTGPGPRLKFSNLILRNNIDNDVAALFDLSQSSQEMSKTPLALDVTARATVSLSSLITNFGASIRILHLIGESPGCPNLLENLFESSGEPDKLVSLTLLLDQVKGTNVDALVKLQSSSKKTFKQLALIAQPLYDEAATKILHALETLDETSKGAQVVVTRTQIKSDDDWILKVEGAMEKSKSATLVVVKSAEELTRIVPGFTEAALDYLETIFARTELPGPVQEEQPIKMADTPKSLASSQS